MFRISLGASLLLLFSLQVGSAQTLVCTPGSGGGAAGCAAHHYHVQMWRPDSKSFTEFDGLNSFASAAACETARTAAVRANQVISEFLRAKQPKNITEAARFGPCHCDMTLDRGHPKFLDEPQRLKQVREAEEVKARLRERLLDLGASSDSEILSALVLAPSSFPTSGWPRFVLPPEQAKSYVISPSSVTLKDTEVARNSGKSLAAESELVLVDVQSPTPASETISVRSSRTNEPSRQAPAVGSSPASPPQEAAAPGAVPASAGGEAPAGSEPASVDEQAEADAESSTGAVEESPADQFVSFESERVNGLMKASEELSDQALRRKVVEASLQRLQLLSNLRRIVEGSGTKSRLSALTRSATDETSRLALVTKLFGTAVAARWTAADPKDALIEIPPTVARDPIAVLRDSSGRFSETDRHLALYMVLARAATMTSTQEAWLTSLIERLVAP